MCVEAIAGVAFNALLRCAWRRRVCVGAIAGVAFKALLRCVLRLS